MRYYYDTRHQRKTIDAYPANMYYHLEEGWNKWDPIDNDRYWTEHIIIDITDKYGKLDYAANIVPDTFLILVGVPLL